MQQQSDSEAALPIAEIPYEDGTVRLRYARYLSSDGSHWIRHGLFESYHTNGQLASQGAYEHGVEVGVWRDFHENGAIAAMGGYSNGKEVGFWSFWSSDGQAEPSVEFVDGVEVDA